MRLFRGIFRHCVVYFQVPRRFFAKSFLAVVKDHPKLMVTVPKKISPEKAQEPEEN